MDGQAGSNPQQQQHNPMAQMLQAATGAFGYPEMALHLLAQQQATGHMVHPVAHAAALHHHQHQQEQVEDRAASRGGGRTRSGDSRSSSAYASRHQQAEARRRTRINERWVLLLSRKRRTPHGAHACYAGAARWQSCPVAALSAVLLAGKASAWPHMTCTAVCCLCDARLDSLRRLVPHAERANTATFLEEVIRYISNLQKRNTEMEHMIAQLQHAPLPGQAPPAAPAAAAAVAIDPVAAAAAAAAGSQLLMQQHAQQRQPSGSTPAAGAGILQALPAQQAMPLPPHQKPALDMQAVPAQHAYAATAAALPAVPQQQPESAAQSGAAALLAAAGHAEVAAGAGTSAGAAKPSHTASLGAAGPSGSGGGSATPPAAADKPLATVQVPDVLQSLLPQGLDLQQMLQQALLSTQAQLLAQLQNHHSKQASSGTAGAVAAGGATGGTGTAATSSGGTSGQPATSTAPLSVLQQSLSGQKAPPANQQGQSGRASQQQQQGLQATTGLLASPPSLVLPGSSGAEAQQQLLQPAPALNISLQQQQPLANSSSPGTAAPAVTTDLQDAANLLAINQIMDQLRQTAAAAAAAAAPAPAAGRGGSDAACAGPGRLGSSPSAAAAPPSGGSPARRAAAAAVAAGAAFSGGDGAGSGGGGMPSLPNLLAMAPPAGVLEQRSSSMSGDRDDDAIAQAVKKRKMLVL